MAAWRLSPSSGSVLRSPAITKFASLAKPPQWQPDAGKVDLCYWFFASEAVRRLGDAAANATWREHLVGALQQGQRLDGDAAGSWDPLDPWGADGGRLYATALATLALQALYAVPALTAPPVQPK